MSITETNESVARREDKIWVLLDKYLRAQKRGYAFLGGPTFPVSPGKITDTYAHLIRKAIEEEKTMKKTEQEVFKEAQADIASLERLLKSIEDKSFKGMFKALKGHNLTDDLFDFNYKSICGTIKNGFGLMNSFEMYGDNGQLVAIASVGRIKEVAEGEKS